MACGFLAKDDILTVATCYFENLLVVTLLFTLRTIHEGGKIELTWMMKVCSTIKGNYSTLYQPDYIDFEYYFSYKEDLRNVGFSKSCFELPYFKERLKI